MKKHLLAALIISTFSISVQASNSSNCKQFFAGGFEPIISNEKLNKNTQKMCFSGFAVNYSGASKTSVWAAEYITPETLKQAKTISREDNFHEEGRIEAKNRPMLADYKHSGYDRGHLAPNGNRANSVDQYESFSLVNIVPQSPKNNQEQWRNVEEATRTLITKLREPAYMITGPLYLAPKVKAIGRKVMVPSHMYKVIYFPNLKIASAYVSVNDNRAKTEVVSLSQLQQVSGIVFIPKLQGTALMNQRYDLPLSANAAYKMREFKLKPSQSSEVLAMMPNEDYLPVATSQKSSNKPQDNVSSIIISKIDQFERKQLNSDKKIIGAIW